MLSYRYSYPDMKKQLGTKFHLTVDKGNFTDSEIIVMLGENGTGKTTFIKVHRCLASLIAGDSANNDGTQVFSIVNCRRFSKFA